ncbi:hypothetical protein Hs20B_15750 [Lactococcus insecticola]|uniref:Uncharacterized protein n=1 Tax=Pseudolactococcus insecticola TaxID=2709158 RepID=A0A6A0BBG8_9LACT|nr:hypothetical protein Hs20B_15750 [Lactococcus insecticola]
MRCRCHNFLEGNRNNSNPIVPRLSAITTPNEDIHSALNAMPAQYVMANHTANGRRKPR